MVLRTLTCRYAGKAVTVLEQDMPRRTLPTYHRAVFLFKLLIGITLVKTNFPLYIIANSEILVKESAMLFITDTLTPVLRPIIILAAVCTRFRLTNPVVSPKQIAIARDTLMVLLYRYEKVRAVLNANA